METQFPKLTGSFLKPADFQDNPTVLTYRGWEKKANVDRTDKEGRLVKSWKDCLDFVLKYSYPEWAKDKAGEPILDDDGKPMRNRNYDPTYPQGYSIVYHFDEGTLESGSMPLFKAFSKLQPQVGEKVSILRTGEKTDTEFFVKRAETASEFPEHDVDEFGASTKLPF